MSEPIFVTKPLLPNKEKFLAYVDQIWQSQWLTNQGTMHQMFEKNISRYLNGSQVTLTVNGHVALETAIRSMELTGEVITTPFSFASTTHAISICGLKPVFCDIKPSDLTIDEDQIEELITEKTSAILPVHVYGHCCNVEKIQEIADRHHLKVIYDAAHAFGVTKEGTTVAAWGDVSIFSFHATKLFNSIEGGALVYKNPALKERLDLLKNFGISDEEHVKLVAGNGKMNEFQAAMGLCNLELMDDVISKRRELTLQYRSELNDIKGLCLFQPEENIKMHYNYAYFPILVDEKKFGMSRDALYEALKQENIFTRKYFYPLIPRYECYQKDYAADSYPVAERVSKQVLTLPLYFDLKPEQISFITNTIRKIQGAFLHA